MLRSSPPRRSANLKQTTQEQPRRSAISTKPLCNFIEITPTHGCAPENPQHTRRNLSPGEHLWGTASVCQKSFKSFK